MFQKQNHVVILVFALTNVYTQQTSSRFYMILNNFIFDFEQYNDMIYTI